MSSIMEWWRWQWRVGGEGVFCGAGGVFGWASSPTSAFLDHVGCQCEDCCCEEAQPLRSFSVVGHCVKTSRSPRSICHHDAEEHHHAPVELW